MGTCTSVIIPNTISYLYTPMYSDVFRIICTCVGQATASLEKTQLVRLLQREIADGATEPNKGRAAPALARLGEPREADLVHLRELPGRQRALRGRSVAGQLGRRRIHDGDLSG